jgi:preprotein translocase subunit YajC
MTSWLTILAQAATSKPAGPQQTPPALMQWMPLLLMAVIFYWLLIRPQSAEKKKRQLLLDNIKKNDRVVTIGGIMGTVISVKDDEITLKVDESSNTKITFTKSAIQRVMSAGAIESSTGPTVKS